MSNPNEPKNPGFGRGSVTLSKAEIFKRQAEKHIKALRNLFESSMVEDGLKEEDSQRMLLLNRLSAVEHAVNGVEEADISVVNEDDEFVIGWSVEDVLNIIMPNGETPTTVCTREAAREVLAKVENHYDASIGVNWDTIFAHTPFSTEMRISNGWFSVDSLQGLLSSISPEDWTEADAIEQALARINNKDHEAIKAAIENQEEFEALAFRVLKDVAGWDTALSCMRAEIGDKAAEVAAARCRERASRTI